MRICLIQPVSREKGAVDVGIPTGLLALGSWLVSRGHAVKLIDGPVRELTPEAVCADALDWNPDFCGFGPMSAQFGRAREIARLLKQARPELPVVFGGPHVSFLRQEILKSCPEIDWIIAGEGEEVFSALLDEWPTIMAGGPLPVIRGLSGRQGGEIRDGGIARPVPLDDYPPFDLSLVEWAAYARRDQGEFGPTFSALRILTGRGCTDRCRFCAVHRLNPGGVRHYPLPRVLELLRETVRQGIRYIKFADDTFGVHREFTRSLAEAMIHEAMPLRFEIETRLDRLYAEDLKLLCQAGLEGVWFGLESLDPVLRSRTGKGIDDRSLREGLEMLQAFGLRRAAFFISGLPGQSPDSVLEDARRARELDLDLAVFSMLTPFPGSPWGDDPTAVGIEICDPDWEHWTEMQPVTATAEMNCRELGEVTRAAYAEFFLSPGYVSGPHAGFRARMQEFVSQRILA